MENSFIYLIYVFFLLVLFLLERNYPSSRSSISKVCLFLYILFWGFRGYIGSDWYNYNYFYESNVNVVNFQFSFEIGFDLLVWLSIKLGLSYQNFVFLITVLQAVLFDRIIRLYCKNIALSYIILISIFPIVIVDLLRNFTSILVVGSGLVYLLEGNRKKFLLCIALGMFFHTSAVFFVILMFCAKKLPSKVVLKVLFGFGFIVYLLRIDLFSSLLKLLSSLFGGQIGYLIGSAVNKDEVSYDIGVGVIEKLFVVYLILKYYDFFNKGKNILFTNCMIIFVIVNFYFGFSQSFINRFAPLFLIGYIVWYCELIYAYTPRYKVNFLIFGFLCFFIFRTAVGYTGSIYRYSNVLIEEDDINQRLSERTYFYRDRGEI